MPPGDLDSNFNELLQRIGQGRSFDDTSFEPVFYLVFHPNEILETKRMLPAWRSRLTNQGFDVHVFSMATAVDEILKEAPLRTFWIEGDRQSPQDWKRTNQSLANRVQSNTLTKKLGEVLDEVATKNSVLLITDLEALHPYMRIGQIESQLQGRFKRPTIILYPGKRTGESRLKFLGFYPEDGNYRSLHIGG